MSVYVIYFSPTKSTENIVKEIAKSFEDYIEIDLANRELNSNFILIRMIYVLSVYHLMEEEFPR